MLVINGNFNKNKKKRQSTIGLLFFKINYMGHGEMHGKRQ
jgi:hypothetical protein